MTPRFQPLRWMGGFFALGLITDILIVLYYRAISNGLTASAMGLSFIVTLIPFLVMWKGIEAKRPELFLSYAIGAAIGTGLGMIINLGG